MIAVELMAGLVLLIVGAELLVRGAARLALGLGIPALVVGLTVVAFGTSAPELAVSVKSAWGGQSELALANAVGSNTFNILFILGLSALVAPLAVSHTLLRRDLPIMSVVALIAVLMAWNGSIGTVEAGLLCLGLVGYTAWLLRQGLKDGADASDVDLDERVQTPQLLLVLAGLVLLVMGARWLVSSAVELATALGLSEAIIGLTIVAAGTSLPEVMTSVMATIRGQRDIAIGNVVGSNIFNILCVVGLSGLFAPEALTAGAQMRMLDLPVMLGVSLLCLLLCLSGARLCRREGVLLLLMYLSYLWYSIALATSAEYLPQLQWGLGIGVPLLVALVVVMVWKLERREAKSLP